MEKKKLMSSHPVMCLFLFRKGGAFVTGAVCFRSVNALVCGAKILSEIAATKGSSSESALVRFLNLTF